MQGQHSTLSTAENITAWFCAPRAVFRDGGDVLMPMLAPRGTWWLWARTRASCRSGTPQQERSCQYWKVTRPVSVSWVEAVPHKYCSPSTVLGYTPGSAHSPAFSHGPASNLTTGSCPIHSDTLCPAPPQIYSPTLTSVLKIYPRVLALPQSLPKVQSCFRS